MDAFRLQTSAFQGAPPRAKTASSARAKRTGRTHAGPVGKATTKAAEVTARKVAAEPSSGVGQKFAVGAHEMAAVQVELTVDESIGEVIVRVFSAGEDDWEPVADALVRDGMAELLQRESRLERTAARFGMKAEALLATLEQSVVDVSDESHGIPEAEREVLASAGINLAGSPDDPTGAGEVLRGAARFAQFRDSALSVVEVASLLGKTEGRVRQMVAAGHLVTVSNGESGYLLPRWQFIGTQPVPRLADLREALAAAHPLTLAGFMTRPDIDLQVDGTPASPVEWLIAGGDPGPVVELATGLAVAG